MCPLHFCWFVLYVWNRALRKLGKMFFISLENLSSFLIKSNFRILDIQISWRHQMHKHKTRNIFYLKKIIKKFRKTFDLKTSPTSYCVYKEWGTTSVEQAICPNQHADFLRLLFTEHSLKIEKSLELVSRPHFS